MVLQVASRTALSPKALQRAQNLLKGSRRPFSQRSATASSSSSSHQREKSPWTGSFSARVPLLAFTTVLSAATALYILYPSSTISLDAPLSSPRLISAQEVGKHSSEEDLWVIVYDPESGKKKVWDLTSFVERHPGGEDVLIQYAGKDASKIFGPIHPKGIIERTLPLESFIGFVDPATLPDDAGIQTEDELRVEYARRTMLPLGAMVNLHDFEIAAEKVLSKTAWSYYASAGDDEYSKRENAYAYSHYWFRPSLLRRPVAVPLDLSVSLLGGTVKSRLPIYISPAAMAKLGHEEGERNLVRGAGQAEILQGISINASCSLEEMVEVRKPGQPLLFQIYLDKNRKNSEALVQKVEKLGFDGIFFTIDSCVPGKRELDIRAKPVLAGAPASKGVAGAISGYQDGNLTWDDLTWLKSLTKLPIIVKGIQSVEDVEVAAQYGASGVVLSNHGGRSLDFSPAPIDVLYELQQTNPDVFKKLDVYIDGGIRRGTDVIKALALGAKAVGLGRPFLYGNGTYGEEGVLKVIQIMEEEISTSLRLLGCTSLNQLRPSMVRYSPRDAAPRR